MYSHDNRPHPIDCWCIDRWSILQRWNWLLMSNVAQKLFLADTLVIPANKTAVCWLLSSWKIGALTSIKLNVNLLVFKEGEWGRGKHKINKRGKQRRCSCSSQTILPVCNFSCRVSCKKGKYNFHLRTVM